MGLSAEQLEMRRSAVGASEVAAVVGLSPYATPIDIWARKTGRAPEQEETAPMRLGTKLEPVIGSEYSEQVAPAHPWTGGTVRHPEDKHAVATPDWDRDDALALVECKAPGSRSAAKWGESGTDEIDEIYIPQCQWQMFVTGRDRCDVAALIGGQDFRHYTIARDQTLIDMLREAVARFWRDHVVADVMPDPLKIAPTRDAVRSLFPSERAPLAPWTPDALAVATDLAGVKAEAKRINAREEALAAQLCALIGENQGFGNGKGPKATWKRNAKGTPAWKAIAEALSPPADLIAKFTGEPPRVLRLSGFGTNEE